MIEVLFYWSIIITIVYLCGYSILRLFFLSNQSTDVCILVGFMAISVYSQFFSLFYKIGFFCFSLMLLLIGLLYILSFLRNKKRFNDSLIKYASNMLYSVFSSLKNQNGTKWVIAGLIIVVASLWTSLPQQYYDTWFYHSQAIRWFEEYGVIKGLGNLHCRFAYNSSFMALQALFGFRFLKYPSYHVVNGLVSVVFALYALFSNGLFDVFSVKSLKDIKRFIKSETYTISDFIKIPIFYWVFRNAKYMSSCQTDDLAMLLVIYIVAKWMENQESDVNKKEIVIKNSILSVLSVWALTVKLSAATLVLLSVYTGALLIKKRNIKGLIGCILASAFVILPWLIRNVIISGWLIYPFPTIDLFDVEWKMPKELAVNDRAFIREFATRDWDIQRFSFERKSFIFISVLAIVGCLVITIVQLVKKKNAQECSAMFVILISLAYWAFSAPAWRFGEPYLMLCIMFFAYKIYNILVGKILFLLCVLQLVMSFYDFSYTVFFDTNLKETVVHPAPYSTPTCRFTEWEGMKIYYPDEGKEIIGYENFPAFNYSDYIWDATIDDVELIGDGLKDGVKWKND